MVLTALILLVIAVFVIRNANRRRAEGRPAGRAGKSVLAVFTIALLAIGSALLSGGSQ